MRSSGWAVKEIEGFHGRQRHRPTLSHTFTMVLRHYPAHNRPTASVNICLVRCGADLRFTGQRGVCFCGFGNGSGRFVCSPLVHCLFSTILFVPIVVTLRSWLFASGRRHQPKALMSCGSVLLVRGYVIRHHRWISPQV